MKQLRNRRLSVGSALAALFLLVAVLPGLAAAAQGVQLQAPVCSPDGAAPGDKRGPLFAADEHCQICPAGYGKAAALPGSDAWSAPGPARVSAISPAGRSLHAGGRAELSPVKGRAPPSGS